MQKKKKKKKDYLLAARECIVRSTLCRGVPFPAKSHRDTYGKDGGWRYICFPTIEAFEELKQDVEPFLNLKGEFAVPQWHFVVDHLAAPASAFTADSRKLET